MNWFKRKTYPQYWQDYASQFRTAQQQDIDAIRFVVFDTETTGLTIKTDRILSIGCVAVQELKIQVADQLEVYIEQDHFNIETVKIHGLLKGGHIEKTDEETAIKQFLDYVRNAVLVAHHAAFDIAMVNQSLNRMGLPKLKNKVLDTGYLFQKTKLDTSQQHFSLDNLADRFNIPLHDRHTASGDAYITAILFLKLIAKLRVNASLKLHDLTRPIKRIGLL